jgi:ribonuclease/clavin/mitogillin
VAIIHSRGGDLGQYLASLERLLTLEPARLLPGHGPVIEQPERILRMTLEHRRTRDRQVASAVLAGHETVHAIAESIYHGLSPELMPLAHENVRAHLEQLRRVGRVAVDGERWYPATGTWTTTPE